MFHILGFLFLIGIVILVLGLSLVGNIVRILFGGRHKRQRVEDINRHYTSSNYENDDTRASREQPPTTRKKIFDDDEGEYVDFEEVKE